MDNKYQNRDGVILPKKTWKEINEEQRVLKQKKLEQEKSRRKQLNLIKKIGLFAGLVGVWSSFGFPLPHASAEKGARKKSNETEVGNLDFNDIWEATSEAFKEITPRVSKASKELNENATSTLETATATIANTSTSIVKRLDNLSENFEEITKRLKNGGLYDEFIAKVTPAPGPVTSEDPDYSIPDSKFAKTTKTPDTKPLVNPNITRKLNISEIEEATSIIKDSQASKPTGEAIDSGPVTATRTPFAQVDTKKQNINYSESAFSTYEQPFEYQGINEVMKELKLTTRDLLYPDTYRMINFNDVITHKEVLPVFSESTSRHTQVIIDEVTRFNLENPGYNFSPNIFLALVEIETDGVTFNKKTGEDFVDSHMGARGIMQVTAPVAKYFNYTHEDMKNPNINVRVGIKYFAEGYRVGLNYGLTEMEAMKYAAMYYNGGPGNANRFHGFRVNKEEDPKIREDRLRVRSQEEVRNYLNKYVGSDMVEGYEYFTYGENMTKVETIKYAESFERLLIEQKIAIELRKKGLTDEEIRVQLSSSNLILKIKSYIKYHQPEYTDIFEDREVADYILDNFENGNLEIEIRTMKEPEQKPGTIFYKLIRF